MNILDNVLIESFGNVDDHILGINTSEGEFCIDENEVPDAWIKLGNYMKHNIAISISYEKGLLDHNFISKLN
jgi:hypothetical protein